MFRNVESHFAQTPQIAQGRSIFQRPLTHKMSGDVGRVYPIYNEVIYPGDTVKMNVSKVVRLQTLLTPILDSMYMDIYFFFIPFRLIWTHWKEFMGENTQSAWIPQVTYTIPTISAPTSTGFTVGGLADHFGLPVGVPWTNSMKHVPYALPFRAYALTMNEFFRDENLTDPLNIPVGDSNQTGTNGDSYINDVANGGRPFKAAKYHDFWTSHLPSPQKGQSVKFPLLSNTKAPVSSLSDMVHSSGDVNTGTSGIIFLKQDNGSGKLGSLSGKYNLELNNGVTSYHTSSNTDNLNTVIPANLWADLTDNVGAVTVNQMRLAFQLQKYYERLAIGGSRYTESIKSLFNVTSPDGRIQRPEYLGGNRVPIAIHEVTNNAQTSQDFLGDLGAMSKTADVADMFVKSFSEHGLLQGYCVCRYDHSYSQGFDPAWLRTTSEQWYNPIFANIGEQPTPLCCLYADTTTMNSDDVFGYQEAWADMRYSVSNRVVGEMRPGIANTLASWHLSDYYASAPTLSDGWIREDPANVDRVLAVQSSVSNQFFADFYFDATWTRVMPMYSIPGLIDHH